MKQSMLQQPKDFLQHFEEGNAPYPVVQIVEAKSYERRLIIYLEGYLKRHVMSAWKSDLRDEGFGLSPTGRRRSSCVKCGMHAYYDEVSSSMSIEADGDAVMYRCGDKVEWVPEAPSLIVIDNGPEVSILWHQQCGGYFCHQREVRGHLIPLPSLDKHFLLAAKEWTPHPSDIWCTIKALSVCKEFTERFDTAVFPAFAECEEAWLPLVARDYETGEWKNVVLCWENSD